MSEAQPPGKRDEDRSALALASARMGTWEWDVTAGTVSFDERMYALFGVEPSTFGGRFEDFLKLLHDDDRARIATEMRKAVEKGGDYDEEFRVARPSDGSIHAIRVRCSVHTGQGCIRVIGVSWDTTERRLAGAAPGNERYLLGTLMDHLPDNIYFKDLESRFVAASRAMARRIGLNDPAKLVGKTDFDVFTAEHARRAFEDERKILETGQPVVNLEEKETWPDGRVTWVSTTKMPLLDFDGRVIGTFGLSRDVTEKRRAQEQLARLAEELRVKNEALQEDLEMARELQIAMLPQWYPRFPHTASAAESAVRFWHFYRPSATISGDFFDVLEISDHAAGVFICDVMGHGVRAALVAAMMRALVGELRPLWMKPAQLMAELNRALCDMLKRDRFSVFASAFFVVADLAEGQIIYANAGHPVPLCVQPRLESGNTHPLNGAKPGPALGVLEEATYETCHRKLSPHDILLLFTDGLFEVEGPEGQIYDYRSLVRAVSKRSNLSSRDLCDGVVEEVQQFSAHREFTDDVCLVAMEVDRLVAA